MRFSIRQLLLFTAVCSVALAIAIHIVRKPAKDPICVIYLIKSPASGKPEINATFQHQDGTTTGVLDVQPFGSADGLSWSENNKNHVFDQHTIGKKAKSFDVVYSRILQRGQSIGVLDHEGIDIFSGQQLAGTGITIRVSLKEDEELQIARPH